ncbi:hypothetical protein, partial [Vibrio cholerae]|uniref:hypothetical protein n=1 Tax=Vibrio cholerae TaxID=666 RepID=UPI00050C62AA
RQCDCQFAERALEEIETFKASQADQGRVFRINLEGLDVAAMQAEWAGRTAVGSDHTAVCLELTA